MRKDSKHFGVRIQTLQAAPKALSAGQVVAYSSQKAAHLRDHEDGLFQRRRLCRRRRRFSGITAKRLPLDIPLLFF